MDDVTQIRDRKKAREVIDDASGLALDGLIVVPVIRYVNVAYTELLA